MYNFKRWSEQTRPICPYALKSGDRACYVQCVHSFTDGTNDKSEILYGCHMADLTVLQVEKLSRDNVAKSQVPQQKQPIRKGQ